MAEDKGGSGDIGAPNNENEHHDGSAAEDKRSKMIEQLLLGSTRKLRKSTNIDEGIFRTNDFEASPRDFVIWTALDEVEKTYMVVTRMRGFLDEGEAEKGLPIHSIERTLPSMVIEEEQLRARRLFEALIQLILFSEINDEEPYYRHFLLIREACDIYRFGEDLAEFHSVQSGWMHRRVDELVAKVHALEPSIDPAKAWYAAYRPPLANGPVLKRILTSERERFKRAHRYMTDPERLAAGTTYVEAFGFPSSSIHYEPGVDRDDRSLKDERQFLILTKLEMLALGILRRCHILLGKPPCHEIERFAAVADVHPELKRLSRRLNVGHDFSVGDFVAVYGYLGEVTGIQSSVYGHRAIRVEFLAERPFPDLAGDWFRVRDVESFHARDDAKQLASVLVGSEVDDEAVRAMMCNAWKQGARPPVREPDE